MDDLFMKKRGQVTIFIVLGIIILVFTGIYFYASKVNAKIKSQSAVAGSLSDSDSQIVATYAESCIKRIGQEALFDKIGMQGGYIDVDASTPSTTYLDNDVPYYLEANCLGTSCTYTETIPSLPEISETLSDYIIAEFEDCFKTEIFSDRGLEIIKPSANINADVIINKEDVSILLNYPLTIKKGKSEAKIESFSVTLPIRLKALHDSANDLIKKITDTGSNSYTITTDDCDSFDKNGLTNVYVKTIDDGTKIIQFVDFSTYLKNYFNSYIFQFALKGVDINGGCPAV